MSSKIMANEWKWSDGSIPTRSYRKKPEYVKDVESTQQPTIDSSVQIALLSENDTWTLDEYKQEKPLNKREDSYNRISEREMMCQMGRNPFMTENSYSNDVNVQDQFLKPVCTSFDREKSYCD